MKLSLLEPPAASYQELELWPDALWRLSSLLKAGLSPARSCQILASYLQEEEKVSSPPGNWLLTCWSKISLEAREQKAYELARRELSGLILSCAQAAAQGQPLAPLCQQEASRMQRASNQKASRQLAACWQVSEASGASLAQVLEELARYCEVEIDLLQQRQTALSGPKATGKILSWLPLLGLGLGGMMGAKPLQLLFGSWAGALLGLSGLLLALAGSYWTGRLIARAEEGNL